MHQSETTLPKGMGRWMDVHVVDRRTGAVVLRYEVKTNSGRPTPGQLEKDEILRRQGRPVHYVQVYTADQTVLVNGVEIRDYLKTIVGRTGRVVSRGR